MHAAHEAFVSRPVFCKLTDLFALLDKLELRDRNIILGPVYQELFRTLTVKAPAGMDEACAAMQWLYDRFKEKGLGVTVQTQIHSNLPDRRHRHHATLMWLYAMSDEQRIPEVAENNIGDAELARQQFARGEIDQGRLNRIQGEIEERLNNISLLRDRYVQFCEHVVARLPQQPAGT